MRTRGADAVSLHTLPLEDDPCPRHSALTLGLGVFGFRCKTLRGIVRVSELDHALIHAWQLV